MTRIRDEIRKWVKFIRTPARGPFWQEHPDR